MSPTASRGPGRPPAAKADETRQRIVQAARLVFSERGYDGATFQAIAARADLADCMAEVRRNAEEWKHAPGLAMSDVLATGLSALPAVVARNLWSSMLLGNDFCITNIPGPPFQVFLAGAGVEGIYAVSPPSGAALNVSLISAGERACITITADVAAIPDSPKLAGCIEDGFAEVCSAQPPEPPRSP